MRQCSGQSTTALVACSTCHHCSGFGRAPSALGPDHCAHARRPTIDHRAVTTTPTQPAAAPPRVRRSVALPRTAAAAYLYAALGGVTVARGTSRGRMNSRRKWPSRIDLPDEDTFTATPPDALICPITRCLMSQPAVCVTTGRTYELSALLRWIAERGVDPLDRESSVTAADLAPNLNVRCACMGVAPA